MPQHICYGLSTRYLFRGLLTVPVISWDQGQPQRSQKQ